jgi:5-methylthioadenosine/S-adenosylhomocysteine deaminase
LEGFCVLEGLGDGLGYGRREFYPSLEDHQIGGSACREAAERREEDPWENVVEADPSWVQLVMIGGKLVYGGADWMPGLGAFVDQERVEPLLAWGKPMLLDTSYTGAVSDEEQPRLSELRSALIDEYPQVGPIFA